VRSPRVVFDLDGTLLDTHADLIVSLNYTIAALKLPPVSYDDVTHLVGSGAQVMIERACKLHGYTLTAEELPALLQRFITHYSEAMSGATQPYPGLVAALTMLKSQGYKLAVCTNKMESLARTLLERLELTHYFEAITGGDTFTVRKPNAEHLIGTVERAGGDIARTVMNGDSINEIPFGYSDVGVETLGPSRIIYHYDELTPELVEGLLAA